MPNVMEVLSSCIRGSVIAPAGKRLCVADLANIEGRLAAWLADEEWKIQAFREFDAGTGPDLYKLAYAKSFGVKPEDVNKEQRTLGKVQELALSYGGGAGAFSSFATIYGIDLESMADNARGAVPEDVLIEAAEFLAWMRKTKGNTRDMSDNVFIVCDSFKRLWRGAHPGITRLWKALDDAVRNAIDTPSKIYPAGPMKVQRTGNWLRIKLPSGRMLCYPHPKIEDNKITYAGVNQYSRKWERISTWGPKVFENICQGVARDVLAHGMQLAEKEGYEPVCHVHDELICETPDTDQFTGDGLARLMASNPPWADGLPLAAEGFHAYRYRK